MSHQVLLIRHGETHGYFDDVGLTDHGRAQAAQKGKELAATLPDGAAVRMPHAPTARATATAAVLRETLLAELGPRAGSVGVGPLVPDARFDSLQFLLGDTARESSGVAAHRLRLREEHPGDAAPDWAAEYDRFDSDYGDGSRAGGPIDRWMTSTTRHFEPPQVTVYRAWAGVLALAAGATPGGVDLVSTHSALLRAFAAAAHGRDRGEPANLEHVAVTVDLAAGRAVVGHRGQEATVDVPSVIPPWIDPAYLAGRRAAHRPPG